MHIDKRGVQLKLVNIPAPFFKGNISVADCMSNNNNQYIYKQRQSHAMSQRRWLVTAVIFRPSDMSLGFAET